MVAKYRDTIDIVAQILRSAAQGKCLTKTQIMYEAFLSFEQQKKYILLLTEEGLLADYSDGYSQLYKTTEKGIRFLKLYHENGEYISAIKEEENLISDRRHVAA
jgi:predicted transcriptional regulator